MKLAKCANCDHRFDVRAHDRCPECGVHYSPRKQVAESHPLGYPQCHWEADRERCRYPATMTSSTQADPGTQWFCSGHFNLADPTAGASIVEASRGFKYAPRDVRQLNIEAAKFCRENGLKTVEQMSAYARHGVPNLVKKMVKAA